MIFVLDGTLFSVKILRHWEKYDGFEKEDRIKQKDQGVRISRTTEHYASLSWSLNVKISYSKQKERYGGCQTEVEGMRFHYF